MAQETSVKEAIDTWEKKSGERGEDAKQVILHAQFPAIQKMDPALSKLTRCEHLSLSTNAIKRIENLNSLHSLKILSLGKNNITSLDGLEMVGDTLTELWISHNKIERLYGINMLRKLEVLYISQNLIKEWDEFSRLSDLEYLKNLLFTGNPLEEKHSKEGNWREEVGKRLPKLSTLDDLPLSRVDDM